MTPCEQNYTPVDATELYFKSIEEAIPYTDEQEKEVFQSCVDRMVVLHAFKTTTYLRKIPYPIWLCFEPRLMK